MKISGEYLLKNAHLLRGQWYIGGDNWRIIFAITVVICQPYVYRREKAFSADV